MKPELVFGLVGPIGVDMTNAQIAVCDALKKVDYIPHTIHLSELMDEFQSDKFNSTTTTFSEKIYKANALRTQTKANELFAALAIREIRRIRGQENVKSGSSKDGASDKSLSGHCYVVRQLKRPEEIAVLTEVYGRKFVQVSVSANFTRRVEWLTEVLNSEDTSKSTKQCRDLALELIQTDEDQKSDESGQRVGKIFHRADVFLDGENENTLTKTSERFIQAFFGKNSIGPTKDEFGSYMAKAASLRSVDLSRQVGAAILTNDGDIISMGSNEIPKFGGGNYWEDDEPKSRDIDKKIMSNKVATERIAHDFLSRLEIGGQLAEGLTVDKLFEDEEFLEKIAEAEVFDITEFGRMTHAEMSAICDAARLGRSLKDATIYVTTFPCHNCAKHIVACGLSRVVYIEPYPKSQAKDLHEDSIKVNDKSTEHVILEHFTGIAPKRYRDIFEKGKRRGRDGKIQRYYEGVPMPLLTERDMLHVSREPHIIKKFIDPLFSSEDPD